MTNLASSLGYDELINRQQKRISALRLELSYYNSKLRQLQRSSFDFLQTVIAPYTPPDEKLAIAQGPQTHSGAIEDPRLFAAASTSTLPERITTSPIEAAEVPQIMHPFITGLTLSRSGVHEGTQKTNDTKSEKTVKSKGGNIGVKKRAWSGKSGDNSFQTTRYWTETEHFLFLFASNIFGPKNYAAISKIVATRTPRQVRTHAQRYQQKLKREREIMKSTTTKADMEYPLGILEQGGNEIATGKIVRPRQRCVIMKQSDQSCVLNSNEINIMDSKEGNSSMNVLASFDEVLRRIEGTSGKKQIKETGVSGMSIVLGRNLFDQ